MHDLSAISQLLLQFSPDALFVVDAVGIIRYANSTAETMFGYPAADLLGKSIEVLVPERFHLRHGAHLGNYLRDPTNREMGARMRDLFARRASGSEFPAGIRLAPFHSGEQTYVATAVRDMTERRAINDALVAAQEEADRANRAKSRFLATASHDLRQPMQTVRMLNASMLKLVDALPQFRELLLRQEAAIDGASRLLNALLDISRLESGAIEPVRTDVALSAVYRDLQQEFEPAAAAKSLRMEFPVTPLAISTDRVLFAQLLQNLIGNALKYTEHGFVRLVQTLEPEALILSVEDSGVGIPEEKLDRIFDEYYQVGPEGTQRLGVGLGLAIVREVARILGYSVAVFSTVDGGTQVHVRVPSQHLLAQSAEGSPLPLESPRASSEAGARGRIVLLEDNDSVRRATELFLTLEGYEVQSAEGVAEAEELLARMSPGDILVTDYRLGGSITGLDVARELRSKQGRAVPVIVLSGDLQSLLRVVRTPVEQARFLSKPVDTHALLQALAELSAV